MVNGCEVIVRDPIPLPLPHRSQPCGPHPPRLLIRYGFPYGENRTRMGKLDLNAAPGATREQSRTVMKHKIVRPHHLIRRLRVTGGFLDGLDIEFLDGLNCIIGPRGAGKTTVIELTRFAVDAMPGREGDFLRKRVERIIAANLDGGMVEVTIETKDGAIYVISRYAGEDPVVMDESGQSIKGLMVRGGHLFRTDILSQNQMESIAETAHYQLDLIDKFSDGEIAHSAWEIECLRDEIDKNASEMLPNLAKIQTLSDEIRELPVIEEKLKGMLVTMGPNADAINLAHAHKGLRDRETRAVEAMLGVIGDLGRTTKAMVGRMHGEIDTLFTDEMREGPSRKCLESILGALEGTAAEVEDHITAMIAALSEVWRNLNSGKANLDLVHAEQESVFRQLMEKHKEAQARSTERSGIEKRRNELIFKQRELGELKRQSENAKRERDEKLAQLSDLFDGRFSTRQRIASDLSRALGPEIRVTVEQCGDRVAYRERLEGLLRIPSIRGNVVARKISDSVPPLRLVELIRLGDREALATACGLNENQAAEAFPVLSQTETLLALETVELDDAPAIELQERGDYRESGALSTGLKCTAILPIILFESINPLVIDQPEDNLDNSYVYKTVVKSIRKATAGRQMIFATHNPNIPVLGDAARIFVMDSCRTQGTVVRVGDVDECKEDIVTLLEGGEEAFKLRKKRYNY